MLIGIVPGVGGSVATMVAYSSARRASKQPEMFGKGAREGIAAPEASNNGLVGGSLIPVLALGIPGSPAAAIFMGAIFLHGMTPGPNFLVSQGNLVYLLIMAVFMAAVVQLLLGFLTIGSFANILKVPPYLLFPSLLVICCIGAYVVRGLEFDMWLFSGFGLAAFFLVRLGFNPGAFILGMILGGITEGSLLETLTLARAQGGLLAYFMGRTIALIIIGMVVIYFAWRLFSAWRTHEPRSAAEASARAETREVGRGPDCAAMTPPTACCCLAYAHGCTACSTSSLPPPRSSAHRSDCPHAQHGRPACQDRLLRQALCEQNGIPLQRNPLDGALRRADCLGAVPVGSRRTRLLRLILPDGAGSDRHAPGPRREKPAPRALSLPVWYSASFHGIAAYIVFKIFFGIVTPTGLIG